MNYECSHCGAAVFIPNGAAWPEQCARCRVWHPGFRSPGFGQVIHATTSVIAPGLSIQSPIGGNPA